MITKDPKFVRWSKVFNVPVHYHGSKHFLPNDIRTVWSDIENSLPY